MQVNMNALPVYYTAQTNPYVDDIFEWTLLLSAVHSATKQHNQHKGSLCKATLLKDNYAAHPDKIVLYNHDGPIQASLSPTKYTTSVIQPLDGAFQWLLHTSTVYYYQLLFWCVLGENKRHSSSHTDIWWKKLGNMWRKCLALTYIRSKLRELIFTYRYTIFPWKDATASIFLSLRFGMAFICGWHVF